MVSLKYSRIQGTQNFKPQIAEVNKVFFNLGVMQKSALYYEVFFMLLASLALMFVIGSA
jgi:hypothetical protein